MEISNNYTKIKELINDTISENHLCFDCLKNNIHCVSVNNGVFLCNNCSSAHKMIFTNEESNIILLDETHPFEDKDYLMLKTGGNKRFKKFLLSYNIDIYNFNSIPIKYTSKASIYYRDMLECEVKGDKQTLSKPSIEEGKKVSLIEEEVLNEKKEDDSIINNIEKIFEKSKTSIINTKDELISDFKSGKLKDNVKSSLEGTGKFISESTIQIGEDIKNVFSSFSTNQNSLNDYDICFEKVFRK